MTVMETRTATEPVETTDVYEMPADLDPAMAVKAQEFVEAYTNFRPTMCGIARRMSSTPEDAEDVVQTAFANAWQGLERFNEGTNMKAWLNRITANTAISAGRKVQRGVPMSSLNIHDNEAEIGVTSRDYRSGSPSAEATALDNDLYPIADLLKGLPVGFGHAVYNVDIQDKPYKQYAEEAGIPIGTVMSRLNRGRAQILSALIERAGITPEEATTRRGRAKLAAAIAINQTEAE